MEMRSSPSAPAPVWRSQIFLARSAGGRPAEGVPEDHQEVVAERMELREFHQGTFKVTMSVLDLAVSLPPDEEDDLLAGGRLLQDAFELPDRGDLLPVDLDDDVACREPRLGGFAVVA